MFHTTNQTKKIYVFLSLAMCAAMQFDDGNSPRRKFALSVAFSGGMLGAYICHVAEEEDEAS